METFAFMSLGIVSGLLYHEHLWQQVSRAGSGKRHSVFYNFWTRYLMLAAVMLFAAKAGGNSPLFLLLGVLIGRPLYLYIFRRRFFRLRGVPER
ncbi:MAG: ATP synthase subunit I [Nitrospirota bacterium]|nr:ATP synthase subunit I [Nitrospirota bacterium]